MSRWTQFSHRYREIGDAARRRPYVLRRALLAFFAFAIAASLIHRSYETDDSTTSSVKEVTEIPVDDDGVLSSSSTSSSVAIHRQRYETYSCKPFGRPGSLPDFLVIGVHKGGSTALYAYLSTHPQVVPATCKETHFFSTPSLYQKGPSYYRRLFRRVRNDMDGPVPRSEKIVTGEGTPDYVRLPIVPERVKKVLANRIKANKLQFILSMRNPTDRFVSHFVGRRDRKLTSASCREYFEASFKRMDAECGVNVRTAVQDPDFLPDSLRRCFARKNENPLSRSVYVYQIQRWMEFFDPKLFFIVQSETLFTHTLREMNALAEFLGVEPFRADMEERWRASAKKMQGSHHSTEPIAKSCDEVRVELDSFFEPFNALLFRLLAKDFGIDVREKWSGVWSGM